MFTGLRVTDMCAGRFEFEFEMPESPDPVATIQIPRDISTFHYPF